MTFPVIWLLLQFYGRSWDVMFSLPDLVSDSLSLYLEHGIVLFPQNLSLELPIFSVDKLSG